LLKRKIRRGNIRGVFISRKIAPVKTGAFLWKTVGMHSGHLPARKQRHFKCAGGCQPLSSSIGEAGLYYFFSPPPLCESAFSFLARIGIFFLQLSILDFTTSLRPCFCSAGSQTVSSGSSNT